MIPIHLKIKGFLSYHDPVELDFSTFDLACIAGQNGAGKSSLLDAITWVLFGQARKRDESIINLQSQAAEVAFTFSYENTTYRVIRSLARSKTTTLEFQIQQAGSGREKPEWHPLTEHSLRETQARLEKVLRLDYDTFVNVSFFLQGRADQFAQQPANRRKEILGNILGLETWEVYKERAADCRKTLESTLESLLGRLEEIDTELTEEQPRKTRLEELNGQLAGLTSSRKLQETVLENVKHMRTELKKQRELVEALDESLKRSQADLEDKKIRLSGRESERLTHADLLKRAARIEKGYTAWLAARKDLEQWDRTASQFHEQEKQRLPFREEINAEQARLEQEKLNLQEQELNVKQQVSALEGLEKELGASKEVLTKAEANLAERHELEGNFQAARERQAELRVENVRLKNEMDEIKLRMDKLENAQGATCPLCGQSLSPQHRQSTLEQLQAEGKTKGDAWRLNKTNAEELAGKLTNLDTQIGRLASAESNRLAASNTVAQLNERLETMKKQARDWATSGAKRLPKVISLLERQNFSIAARRRLAKVDEELSALGYDTAAHDAARQRELQTRSAEIDYRNLESARSALKPIENEIANLKSSLEKLDKDVIDQQSKYDEALEALKVRESQAPELDLVEKNLYELVERENQLHQEVGAARQKVNVLDELRERKKRIEGERQDIALEIGRYKALERAFGKDGVPALLIEQALPEIEMKANEILGRLSEDSMYLHFETQAKYKAEKRKDLRETLDIQVSDGAGMRDYEMFSGGEAFRVNFAIRLALSEVLAVRKGARLQMLVIDEGFGSQDSLGRQRLIQAINAVKGDFAKILVITHLEELKDAFPSRIEVEKTNRGSTLTVV